jgi:hypothetical protein
MLLSEKINPIPKEVNIGKHGKSSWTLEKRLSEKIIKSESGCWVWIGARQKSGHGSVCINGTMYRAHRVLYTLHKGDIPEGLVLDHLCRNPSCVNPDHLEPVTQHENLLRGNGASANNHKKTHCKRGHELSGDNLKLNVNNQRVCIKCRRLRDIKYKRKAKC